MSAIWIVLEETKYLVDIAGGLSTILGEIDVADSSLKKSYVYADGQILSQRVHTDPTDPNVFTPYFYVHDRLGSVRLVVGYASQFQIVYTANSYTYTPFGSRYDVNPQDGVDDPWQFTGQWHDGEIDQYYLRARMYDPTMMRFTSRDPVFGKFTEPATLHMYLYCWNNPINFVDLNGECGISVDALATMAIRSFVGANTGFVVGVYREILTELAMGGDLNAAKILGKGVSGAILGVLAGGYGGITNPGYAAFISNGGSKILADMAFSLVAGAIADIGGRSIEGALTRNLAHVLATNAMIDAVYYGDW
jgi:RHS repeat-associated protein